MQLAESQRWVQTHGLAERGPADAFYGAAAALRPPRTTAHCSVAALGRDLAATIFDDRWDLEHRPSQILIPREREETGDVEQLAWYRSWHTVPSDAWGIYIGDWGLHIAADSLTQPGGSRVAALQLAARLLVGHEMFHALVDIVSTNLEMAIGAARGIPTPFWRDYFLYEYLPAVHSSRQIEEALANAFAVRRASLSRRDRGLATAWFSGMAHAYGEFGRYVGERDFATGTSALLAKILRAPLRTPPGGSVPPLDTLLTGASEAMLSQVPVYLVPTIKGPGGIVGTRPITGYSDWAERVPRLREDVAAVTALARSEPKDDERAGAPLRRLQLAQHVIEEIGGSVARAHAAGRLIAAGATGVAMGDHQNDWDDARLEAAHHLAGTLARDLMNAHALALDRGPSLRDKLDAISKHARDPQTFALDPGRAMDAPVERIHNFNSAAVDDGVLSGRVSQDGSLGTRAIRLR